MAVSLFLSTIYTSKNILNTKKALKHDEKLEVEFG